MNKRTFIVFLYVNTNGKKDELFEHFKIFDFVIHCLVYKEDNET